MFSSWMPSKRQIQLVSSAWKSIDERELFVNKVDVNGQNEFFFGNFEFEIEEKKEEKNINSKIYRPLRYGK